MDSKNEKASSAEVARTMRKIYIGCSNLSKVAGLHRHMSSFCAKEQLIASNSWVRPWKAPVMKEFLTKEELEFLELNQIDVNSLIGTTSVPVKEGICVPEDVIEFLSKSRAVITDDALEKGTAATVPTPFSKKEAEDVEIPQNVIDYYKEVAGSEKSINISFSSDIPELLSEGISSHIRVQRGIRAEVAAIETLSLPEGKAVDEQLDGSYETKYFRIKGRIDATIYDENGNMIGLVEVKCRMSKPKSLQYMLSKDESGLDGAYDLRQIAGYWKCFPGLKYYYLLEMWQGKHFLTRLDDELLGRLWDEMEPVLIRRCKKLLKEYCDAKKRYVGMK